MSALLADCGYGITRSGGREVASSLFLNAPCVMLLDVSAAGGSERLDQAVRLARIAGIPIIAVGGAPDCGIRGLHARLSGTCDDVALVAAVEVACYGHDHGRAGFSADPAVAAARMESGPGRDAPIPSAGPYRIPAGARRETLGTLALPPSTGTTA